MADFGQALPFVLQHEGGWSDDPRDPGGATNYGITLGLASRYGITTKDALRTITPEQVADIYRAEFWRFAMVRDQRIATKIFDLAVNMGPKSASLVVQKAVNLLGGSLVEDGVWGDATKTAVNAWDAETLLDQICRQAQAHYEAIVRARPESAAFLHGWVNRAWDVPEVVA